METRKHRKKRAKKAQAADAAAAAQRELVTLASLKDAKGRHWLPSRVDKDTGLSDDEDWLQDEGHPIDWYVQELSWLIDTDNTTLERELRMKLNYAWRMYAPEDPCPFIRCQERSGDRPAVTCATMARFARHLVETHLPNRMTIYCVSGGPNSSNACRPWNDGEFHRHVRRGEVVRHLMKNGIHNLPLTRALTLVNQVWTAQEGKVSAGKLQKRMVPNTLKRRFRLTEHDWQRCIGKSALGSQETTGDTGVEDTARELEAVKTASKRGSYQCQKCIESRT